MGMIKHGEGEVIPDPQRQKTASSVDPEELARENAEADAADSFDYGDSEVPD